MDHDGYEVMNSIFTSIDCLKIFSHMHINLQCTILYKLSHNIISITYIRITKNKI